MEREIKAIETKYNGILFRSRLEARWAYFFDKLGVKWIYEHEGYETPYGRYLPDFWLPDVYMRTDKVKGIYFEVKPESYEGELHKPLEYVCTFLNCGGLLAKGFPTNVFDVGKCLFEISPDWDIDMVARKCKNGHIIFDYDQYLYDDCPKCGSRTANQAPVELAIEAALQNRFW